MDFIQILILSIIQGVTEFLPISSQSHLILTSIFLDMKDQGLGFDIALHTGSLIAILIYYRKEIAKMLSVSDEGVQYIKLIIIGSIPLPIIGLLFIDLVKVHMRSVESIALMTIIFAILLYIADLKKKENINNLKSISIFTIIFIGFMQTLAIMPGVSRAGIVITAALLTNYNREDSIKIAFLLSIPAIFMATVYQSMQLYGVSDIQIINEHLLGMLLSFVFSYITIHLFISTINKITFIPYIIYRLILGTILIGFV
ncbi:MAG: undecaprenyl-diphosphatase [Gammaproteobacteria bacterium]|nr:undecaprenyl-diphosphatase [Gammaproteobacteria bacterium]|tara:strand:- start:977 stop:1747 length:771 start_codon:yes stop_codon:yes gene_type:complete